MRIPRSLVAATRAGWSALGARPAGNRTGAALAPTAALLLGLAVTGGCRSAAAPSGLTPLGEYQRQRLAAAMAGLVYDGEVRLDPTLPALPHDPAAALALVEEGRTLVGQGRVVEAIRAFSDAVRSAPELAEPYEWLGRALVSREREAAALAAFRTAVARDPTRTEARYEAACTWQRLSRPDEAIAGWEELLTLDPDHGPAHARLAAALSLRGDLAAAAEHLAAALALGAPVPRQLASLVEGGEPPRATLADASGSVVIGGQVRVDVGGGTAAANETTAAASGLASPVVTAGWNDYRVPGLIRTAFALSSDGGATWVDGLLRPALGHEADVEGDPMTARDDRTGTLWAGGISFGPNGGVFVARKAAGASSFAPAVMTVVDPGCDKGWLAAGPAPGDPAATRLYVAYNLGLQVSTTMGASWSAARPLDPWGLGYLPRVGPGGELYVAYWDNAYGVMLQRSLDGGTTVEPPVTIATRMETWNDGCFPGDFRVPPLTSLAVDPRDGTLYAVWFDTTGVAGGNANVDLYFSRSSDRGSSWSAPRVVNGDSVPPGDQFFPWVEVDHRGRLHLLFYDTRNTPQDDGDPRALVDAYYSFSDDRGDSWSEHRLTPAPFDSTYATGGSGQFIGDYNGMAVAGERAWPVYLSTQNGDRDIFTHTVLRADLFADGFETGGPAAWTLAVP
jgi:tetratricopeptide (TPR) repeat protein